MQKSLHVFLNFKQYIKQVFPTILGYFINGELFLMVPIKKKKRILQFLKKYSHAQFKNFSDLARAYKDLRRILTYYIFKRHPLTSYIEVRYGELLKKVIPEKVSFAQDFKNFTFTTFTTFTTFNVSWRLNNVYNIINKKKINYMQNALHVFLNFKQYIKQVFPTILGFLINRELFNIVLSKKIKYIHILLNIGVGSTPIKSELRNNIKIYSTPSQSIHFLYWKLFFSSKAGLGLVIQILYGSFINKNYNKLKCLVT